MSSAVRISLPRQPWQHALAGLADERGAIGEAVLALPMQSLIDAFQAVIS